MTTKTYAGILKSNHKAFYTFEHHCPDELLAKLLCKLEYEFPFAEAQVIAKPSGKIVYHCRKSAIC
jgi:hypothetical protein